VRNHTTEVFGPVRAVEPDLVFEVAFDAVQPSSRHKSGVAMRFPRISRIRWDKPAREADRLETVKALIPTARS
jgi:DNA ligase-1